MILLSIGIFSLSAWRRDRDGVLHVGQPPGEHRLVVRGRSPREDLGRLRLLVELLHELERFDRLLRVDRDVAGLVLLGAAERPEQGAHGHVRVELLREAESDRVARLVPDLLAALEQVVVGVGPVREAGLRPPVLVAVARVGRVRVGEGEVLLRLRVVRGLVRQVDLLAVLLLDLLVDVRSCR